MKQNKQKVLAYLRVSTTEQGSTEKFEADVLRYANSRELGPVEFVSETVSGMTGWRSRKLAELVAKVNPGDVLIVPELSRLGRSLSNVLDCLNTLTDKGAKVYSVKENFQLNGSDMQSKIMRTMLGLFAEIERDIIVARTREGLALARAQGRIGGRPKGPGKSRLDPHREAIITALQQGVQRQYIARKHGVTPGTLTNWLQQHGLDTVRPNY